MIQNAGNVGIPGVSLAEGISVFDGLLDVILLDKHDTEALSSILHAGEQPAKLDVFRHWQVREVSITCDPPQDIVGDGEDWGQTPAVARVLPGAVSIIASQDLQRA